MTTDRVEGIDYSPEAIESARNEIINLRNSALTQADSYWSVLLSHVIAYLADYQLMMKK